MLYLLYTNLLIFYDIRVKKSLISGLIFQNLRFKADYSELSNCYRSIG